MIKNGNGGSRTNKNGLKFEQEASIIDVLDNGGYSLSSVEFNDDILKIDNISDDVFVFEKNKLYKYIENSFPDFDYKKFISKKLLPDNVILNQTQKIIWIIEVKYQEVSGSVDEKLQTCDFKKKQYQKIADNYGFKVEYIYLLNDWFKKEEYKDVLEYIESVDCKYFFNSIPIEDVEKIIK